MARERTDRGVREREIINQILGVGVNFTQPDMPDPLLLAKYNYDPAFHMVVIMAARAQARLEELEPSTPFPDPAVTGAGEDIRYPQGQSVRYD